MCLNSKFFQYTDSIFQTMINLNKICPEATNPDNFQMLEEEGQILTFNTERILDNIELEQLSSDEIEEVKNSIKEH